MEPKRPVKPTKPPVVQTLAKAEPRPKQMLKDQINKKAKPYKDEDTSVRYRYVCPACTGIAFKSRDMLQGTTTLICSACNRPIGALKIENYIKLT